MSDEDEVDIDLSVAYWTFVGVMFGAAGAHFVAIEAAALAGMIGTLAILGFSYLAEEEVAA